MNEFNSEKLNINCWNIGLVKLEGPDTGLFTSILKRLVDITLASLILVLAAPVFLIVAILIKRDSKGPAIFKQVRIGKNGQAFVIYKFRTMKLNTCKYDTYSPSDLNDRRITRIGKFLRHTSIDELPQFWNVLKNEMSIVGPRPEMPFIVAGYTREQKERLAIKPGITGLWQLSLDRTKLIHENLEHDFRYINNMSIFLDVAIISKTIWFVFRSLINR